VVEVFAPAAFRWWISGGHALDLHLGRTWRSHEDTDVGVVRHDLRSVFTFLAGWDLHVAAAGHLTPSVQVPWALAVLRTTDGVPYLSPELQLLYKSKGLRPKDDVDAAAVIPHLDDRQRELLARLLEPDHAWQRLLG
jgi:hypothetical protein